MTNALVLAGGGVAGIAWGSASCAASPTPIRRSPTGSSPPTWSWAPPPARRSPRRSPAASRSTRLYAAQLRPETAEIEVDVDTEKLFAEYAAVLTGASGPEDARRRLGELALAAQTVDPAVRLAAIDARLPVKQWPDRRMLLPAVDAESGEVALFSRESGVTLLDAVAASCAVPGVWPPVAIGGRHYVDGGVRSMTNADLAAGADRVLIIQPILADAPQPWGSLDAEIAALAPATVHVISADQASVDAFGTNALSPATRAPSARAGRTVGATHAAAVAALWG